MIDKEKINPQILKEWTAAKLPKNKYFVGDINSYLSSLEVATKSNLEARKILILLFGQLNLKVGIQVRM